MAVGYTGGTVTSTTGSGGVTWRYGPGMALESYTVVHKHPNGTTFTFEYGEEAPSGSGEGDPSVATGVDPTQIHNALYGKVIPLSVMGTSVLGGGLERIGTAGLIFGPYFSGETEARVASFAVSFGFPANPEGTRQVYEIALDGKVAWELEAGSPAGVLNPAGFLGDPFECRFYAGTMMQGADPLEAAMFGDQAVAYRPQMMLWFTNLPVTAYDNKCPFVSCKIGDVTGGATAGDGINLGHALEAIAYSPWLEYDAGSFEAVGVADIVQAMILTEDESFLDLLRITNRVYRTFDILQTDMLRIKDRGSTVAPDVSLHRDHISADGGVQYLRAEESSVAREMELVTIDPDADYVFMPSKAARPKTPVPVTSSVAKESITLPVVIDANTRASLVTYAKYEEDNARKRLSLQTLLYGYALEPGDLFNLTDVADGFDNSEIWKVIESSHGANYINEISAEAILKCAIDVDGDPYWDDVILLLHANTGMPPIDHSQYAEAMQEQGGVAIDTTLKVFGTGSFLFDGVDERVETISSGRAWWDISPTNASPYTIELWARPTELPSSAHQTLICRNAGIAARYWHFYIPTGTEELRFAFAPDGVNLTEVMTTTGADLVVNTWYHLAVDKDSTGTIRIYVNGVMRATATPADSTFPLGIGASIDVGGAVLVVSEVNFQGNIDDVRITKRSRYGDLYADSSFSPPAAQFPDGPP